MFEKAQFPESLGKHKHNHGETRLPSVGIAAHTHIGKGGCDWGEGRFKMPLGVPRSNIGMPGFKFLTPPHFQLPSAACPGRQW